MAFFSSNATLSFTSSVRIRRGMMAATALAGLVSPVVVQAQNQTAAQASSSDESVNATDIIVTAQFRGQRLQDVPLAITAETGEKLAQKGITNVAELAGSAPNVNISGGSQASGPSVAVYIRGIGQYDNSFAYEPGVGIYIDDVYYGVIQGANFELLDLDRVEVLRGPQGTLAGKNSLGGAIKLYSKLPDWQAGGFVEAGYGAFDAVDLRASLNVPVVDDLIALRVSGFTTRKDGYLDRIDFACANPGQAGSLPVTMIGPGCKVGTEGGKSMWGLRVAVRITPTPDLDINLALDRTEDTSETGASTLYYANNPGVSYGGVPYDSRFIPKDPYTSYATNTDPATGYSVPADTSTKAWGVTGDVTWRVADGLQLRSITAYREMHSIYGYDQDASPLLVNLSRSDLPYHQFTQELRVNGEAFANALEWTLGGFYFDAKGMIRGRVLTPPLDFFLNDPVQTTSKAVFGQAIIHPVLGLNLTLGVRYTDDKKSYRFSRLGADGNPALIVGALDQVEGKFAADHVDYRIALDYRWSRNFLTYAQFSTGYKGGGVNPKPFFANQVIDFNPETLDAYEIGFKSDLFGRALRLNAAAFLNKYKDIILINANGIVGNDGVYTFPSAAPFNAGDADIKGLEVEASTSPIKGLTLEGSISYLDFEYTRLADAALASGIEYDDVPPLTPKWQWTASAAYEIPLGDLGSVTPRVDVQHTSAVYIDPANNAADDAAGFPFYRLPGRTTANARVSFTTADERWTAALSITNLTNKIYYTNGFAFMQTGTGTRLIAPPREWMLTLRHDF